MNETQRLAEIERLKVELAQVEARRIMLTNELAGLATDRRRIHDRIGAHRLLIAMAKDTP